MTDGPAAHGLRGVLAAVRRYAYLSLALEALALVVVCVVTLALAEVTVFERVGLAAAVVLVTTMRTIWLHAVFVRRGSPRVPLWQQAAVMAGATLSWAYATVLDIPAALAWALVPGAALSAVVALQPMRRWGSVALATGGVAAAGTVGLLAAAGTEVDLRRTGVTGLLVMLVVVAVELIQVWYFDVVEQLDEARKTSAALAIVRERLRFAADMHDTQGHYLEVIALKAELVDRLLDGATAAARQHARDIFSLARQALNQTREVVVGYRRTSLRLELDNAIAILAAASVDTVVDGDPEAMPHDLQPLFAALVREATTNMLRHSDASRCMITLALDGDEASLSLVNDRPRAAAGADAGAPGGSGLAGLHERFSAAGGSILVDRAPEEFTISGRAPRASKVLAT